MTNWSARAYTNTHTGAGSRPREASPYVTFTTRDTLYPVGLDLIHGLKVAYEVYTDRSQNRTLCLFPLTVCAVNTVCWYIAHISGIIPFWTFVPTVPFPAILQARLSKVRGRHGESLVVIIFTHKTIWEISRVILQRAPHSYTEPLFGNCYCLKQQYLSNVTGKTRLL